MLSYRHAFHAGNHADVLKHTVLVQLLRYLTQKDKAFWYIDTHAGAGLYDLQQAQAQKNVEFKSGISHLWKRTDLPEAVADYVAQIKALNPDGILRTYPGSPQLALQLKQADDRLKLYELHSNEYKILTQNLQHAKRHVSIVEGDGFAGLKAMLPPPPRRALVLIDPPYEVRDDYRHVIASVKDSLLRFPSGMYAVWYPRVQRPESRRFFDQLKRIHVTSWLHVTLDVSAPPATGFGLYGSGLFLINPPWTLPETLQQILPYLVSQLGQDDGAHFTLDYEIA